MYNKNYKQEIEIFYQKLQNGDKFSLSRYGDGEWSGIIGKPLICGENTKKNIIEWTTTGEDERFLLSRKYLSESIKFVDDGYFLGICPCYKEMIEYSGQSESSITYANIFVNDNYSFFVKKYIEFFKTQKIHLVANKESKLDNLPFEIEKFYPVDYNAWINNLDLIEEILEGNCQNKLFLFCSGPLSNILCYKLWQKNKNNVYLDIGSTLDLWIDTGNVRGYYMGIEYYSKFICPCPNIK
jgi:hypothetical protein